MVYYVANSSDALKNGHSSAIKSLPDVSSAPQWLFKHDPKSQNDFHLIQNEQNEHFSSFGIVETKETNHAGGHMKGKGNRQRWKGIPTEKNMKTNKETMVEHSQPICRQCQEQTASAKQN